MIIKLSIEILNQLIYFLLMEWPKLEIWMYQRYWTINMPPLKQVHLTIQVHKFGIILNTMKELIFGLWDAYCMSLQYSNHHLLLEIFLPWVGRLYWVIMSLFPQYIQENSLN
jgi:hypothetical protein